MSAKPLRTLDALAQGVTAVTPGLTLGNILRDVGNELKQGAAHGAHELAAALFSGNGFVMYPRGAHDDPKHGLEAPKQEVQQEKGGMER